jgi:hypothetical protein
MSIYDDYDIGDAQQYFGSTPSWADPWQSLYSTSQPLPQGSESIDTQLASALYQSPDYGWDTAMQDLAKAGGLTKENIGPAGLDKFGALLKSMGGKALDFAQTPQGIMALLAAIAGAADRQKAQGGGTKMGMMAPRQYTRTIAPGATGTPIARYAANGGILQAYAGGGHVQMEDGGFVLTKRAVDGAGGPQGIQQLVPGARHIRGPGTGTSDSIPATIRGPNGTTPAKVSNGEAYVPRTAVQQAGGPQRMYALMHSLQRKA